MTNPTGRRHSTGVVIGTGLAGLLVGALVAFGIAGLLGTDRAEHPAPPYPSVSSSEAPTNSAPLTTPSLIPMPPYPTGPH
jgi:hypothetical protein